MMFFNSGCDAVDKIGQMNITGNVVPKIWYKTILTEKKKPHHLAIAILADIVYWYRPVEVRDELTGQILGWKKRFKADMLQRNYESMEEQFGENERTVMRALGVLENLGVIRRYRRTLKFKNGILARNVLFIDLIPEKLYELTFPEADRVALNLQTENSESAYQGNSASRQELIINQDLMETGYEIIEEPSADGKHADFGGSEGLSQSELTNLSPNPDKSDRVNRQICQSTRTNLSPVPDKSVSRPGQICQASMTDLSAVRDRFDGTNTKNITENTTEIIYNSDNQSIYSSHHDPERMMNGLNTSFSEHGEQDPWLDMPFASQRKAGNGLNLSEGSGEKYEARLKMSETEAYMSLIRRNIGYEDYVLHGSDEEKVWFSEMYDVICDGVLSTSPYENIGENRYPRELVRNRFMKLTSEHLHYVMWTLKKVGNIRNPRAYLMAALYNATGTCNFNNTQLFNYHELGVS